MGLRPVSFPVYIHYKGKDQIRHLPALPYIHLYFKNGKKTNAFNGVEISLDLPRDVSSAQALKNITMGICHNRVLPNIETACIEKVLLYRLLIVCQQVVSSFMLSAGTYCFTHRRTDRLMDGRKDRQADRQASM